MVVDMFHLDLKLAAGKGSVAPEKTLCYNCDARYSIGSQFKLLHEIGRQLRRYAEPSEYGYFLLDLLNLTKILIVQMKESPKNSHSRGGFLQRRSPNLIS